jgi:prepilin signal peptidase PulO-like enzyme (type II secretory pathway)
MEHLSHALLLAGFIVAVALLIYDLRAGILPDWLNAVLGLTAVGYHGSIGWATVSPLESLVGAAAGAALLYVVRLAYLRLRGIEALGLGDVKLIAAIGVWVGVWALPAVLLIASLGTLLTVLCLRAVPFEDFLLARGWRLMSPALLSKITVTVH